MGHADWFLRIMSVRTSCWLSRRAGAELAGLDEPDRTLVRHLHDLHALREHYDPAEVVALAREVMLADAAAYGNQFPAYRENPCARRFGPLRASRRTQPMPGGSGNFNA